MSEKVTLKPHNFIPYTLVPNFFIDGFIAKANGEFVKVYLVLLRFMSIGQLDFDLNSIADQLLMTESDVLRALNYFQSEQLITLTYLNNRLTEIHLIHLNPNDSNYTNDSNLNAVSNTLNSDSRYYQNDSVPILNNISRDVTSEYSTPKVISSKPEYTTKEIAYFAENDDFKQLLYIAQKYLGKTLSSNDVKTIISFTDWLNLPIDVIELLIEYCVGNDHRNMRYIEKVAVDWADNEINTIEKAKVRTETYNKSYFVILKAYGITDRTPTPKQIKLMDKWLNDYSFDISIIIEACQRTIAQINKAEMRYTDSILGTWSSENVRTLIDIDRLDNNHQKPIKITKQTKLTNKFNNYSQRNYDYDELEKKALELRLRESKEKRYS